MIWILRHISVHLWIATILTIPTCFYMLPGFTKVFSKVNPVIAGLVIFLFFIMIIGVVLDIIAKKIVTGLVKEGQAWERSGILSKAEKSYIKAVRAYDTFLLWPFSTKRTALKISGAIAKFTLNNSIGNQQFKMVTAMYLRLNPDDVDIAQLWLEQILKSAIVSSDEQEVLSALAEKHYNKEPLSELISNIFIGLERNDFIAKKLYQYARNKDGNKMLPAEETEKSSGSQIDKPFQENLSFIEQKPGLSEKIEIGKHLKSIFQKVVEICKWLLSSAASAISFLLLSAGKAAAFVKENEKVQFYLKSGFIIIISGWLLFFMVSTVSHLFKTNMEEKQKQKIERSLPRPFTIQVAAYLKQTHADNYVQILKHKGIDATVKQVNGGGKTWFVVRVSAFTDKKSAAAYGNQLKQQKIIDDFFVNNK